MVLDVIDCRGRGLIYIQQAGSPRMAIFGKRMMCRPPAIFPGVRDDGRSISVQLTANQGDRSLSMIYKNKRTGAMSPPIDAPLGVPELVRFLGDTPRNSGKDNARGFAIPYSEIVDIISGFSETQTIVADVVVEKIGKVEDPGLEREETEYE